LDGVLFFAGWMSSGWFCDDTGGSHEDTVARSPSFSYFVKPGGRVINRQGDDNNSEGFAVRCGGGPHRRAKGPGGQELPVSLVREKGAWEIWKKIGEEVEMPKASVVLNCLV